MSKSYLVAIMVAMLALSGCAGSLCPKPCPHCASACFN